MSAQGILRWVGALLVSCMFSLGAHAAQRIVVVTSYAQEVLSHVESEFARLNPDLKLEFIWRMPRDAMPYLVGDGGRGVDVYWSASGRNFAELAEKGMFSAQQELAAGLPDRLLGFELSDPAARYLATEVALYGFAVNPDYLAERGLPPPATWSELADPRYRGHVLLPIPSRVGFAPLMIESLLQRLGWNAGWALISQIASNASLWQPGGAFITEEIAQGNAGIGVTIDFFAMAAMANGAPMKFVRPDILAVSPGHVAVMRGGPNPDGAKRFIAFLLSPEGQRVLGHPDIRKLPVKREAYAQAGVTDFDPYAAPVPSGWKFEARRGAARMAVDNAVFDALITAQGDAHARLWWALHAARAAAQRRGDADAIALVEEVHRSALQPPIDEAQSHSPEVRAGLGGRAVRGGTTAPPESMPLARGWQQAIALQYAQAIDRLAAAGLLEGEGSAAGSVEQ